MQIEKHFPIRKTHFFHHRLIITSQIEICKFECMKKYRRFSKRINHWVLRAKTCVCLHINHPTRNWGCSCNIQCTLYIVLSVVRIVDHLCWGWVLKVRFYRSCAPPDVFPSSWFKVEALWEDSRVYYGFFWFTILFFGWWEFCLLDINGILIRVLKKLYGFLYLKKKISKRFERILY